MLSLVDLRWQRVRRCIIIPPKKTMCLEKSAKTQMSLSETVISVTTLTDSPERHRPNICSTRVFLFLRAAVIWGVFAFFLFFGVVNIQDSSCCFFILYCLYSHPQRFLLFEFGAKHWLKPFNLKTKKKALHQGHCWSLSRRENDCLSTTTKEKH